MGFIGNSGNGFVVPSTLNATTLFHPPIMSGDMSNRSTNGAAVPMNTTLVASSSLSTSSAVMTPTGISGNGSEVHSGISSAMKGMNGEGKTMTNLI